MINRYAPQRHKFTFHPSWFGGFAETVKATVELADRTAAKIGMVHGIIHIDDRNSEAWIVTIEFLPIWH